MSRNLTDLDLRLIRIFLAVVDAKGISAAQSNLNIGQPTISTHMATLEARLGFRLCDRGRGGFRLTSKGEKFALAARHLLTTLNDFSIAVHNMERKLVGVLNIGLIDHLAVKQAARISKAIERFHQRDQAVKISISVRSPRDLEEQLVSGQIHIAFGYFWRSLSHVKYNQMFIERQIACCGRGHPLFPRAGLVTTSEAGKYEWAWRTYPLPEPHLSIPPDRVTAMADDMEATAVLIMSGHHLAYLPEHFAEPYIRQRLMAPLNPLVLKYDVSFQIAIRERSLQNGILVAFLQDLSKEQPLN